VGANLEQIGEEEVAEIGIFEESLGAVAGRPDAAARGTARGLVGAGRLHLDGSLALGLERNVPADSPDCVCVRVCGVLDRVLPKKGQMGVPSTVASEGVSADWASEAESVVMSQFKMAGSPFSPASPPCAIHFFKKE
jgi:hypothetical protein